MLLPLLLALVSTTSPFPLANVGEGLEIVPVTGYNGQSGSLVVVHISMRVHGFIQSTVTAEGGAPCTAYLGSNPLFADVPHDWDGLTLYRHDGSQLAHVQFDQADTFCILPADGVPVTMTQDSTRLFRDVAVLTDPADLSDFRRAIVDLQVKRLGEMEVSSTCGAGGELDLDQVGGEVVVEYQTVP